MKRENEYLYTKLSNILREQILTGYIKPGEFLLSENQLAEYYEMSRVSVRKSLETLLSEGLVIKKTGQGTMVVPNLIIPEIKMKTLNILATSPSFYVDTAMKDIIDGFNMIYPNVKVNVISVPGKYLLDNHHDIENVKLDFDLVFIGDDQFNKIPSEEYFQDLNHIFTGCGYDKLMYKKVSDFFQKNGNIYAIPVTLSTVFLAYNPSLFLKYGVDMPSENWTTEDFYKAIGRLTADTNGDGISDQFGFSISSVLTRWITIALQNGVDFKNIGKDMKPLENTLDFFHNVLYHKRSAILFRNFNNMANPFFSQRAAMTLTTALEVSGWKKHQMGFKPKVAAVPFDKNDASVLIANCFLVPTGCKNCELAYSFIKAAVDVDVQKKIGMKYKFLSVLKNVNKSIWSEDYLKSINVFNELDNGRFVGELFTEKQVIYDIEAEMEAYWSGIDSSKITAQKICDIIQDV